MTSSRRDIISGSLFLAVSLIIWFSSYGIKQSRFVDVDPSFMPKLISLLLGVVSVFIIYQGIKNKEESKAANAGKIVKKEKSLLAGTVLIIVIYMALLETVGFLIMTVLCLFAQFQLFKPKKGRGLIMYSVTALIVASSVYFSFQKFLSVILPPGILG